MKKITIAIDGYSSTGKSTIAKKLANHLGYVYVDSGAMYRAVTYFAIQKGFINEDYFDVKGLISHLDDVSIAFEFNPELGFAEVYLNSQNIEKHIRTMEVSGLVSQVATVPEVRAQLVEQQRQMGDAKGVVMDGRDIGTVVFPKAELKLYMTASPEIRAKHRYDELLGRGEEVLYEDVLKNVVERDYIDSHRKDSPLIMAEDAIEIDNSELNIQEQFEELLKLVEVKLKKA